MYGASFWLAQKDITIYLFFKKKHKAVAFYLFKKVPLLRKILSIFKKYQI